jgi:hypothetical protein
MTTEGAAAEPVVRRRDEPRCYEILVGGERVGLAAYRDRGEQRVFFHTEVDDAFAGRGLASVLVRRALEDVRAQGMRAVPVCPYVAKWLAGHEGFADIADPVTDDVLDWLTAELG